MNPFMLGMLGLTGAQNPQMFGQSMAQLGISPEVMNASMQFPAPDALGALINGATPGGQSMSPQPTMTGWDATVTPAGGGAMPQGNPMMQGLQGVNATMPKPFMSAGVSGSQKAPDPMAGGGSSAMIAEIMKLIMGGNNQNPLRVPGLGSMIQGGL